MHIIRARPVCVCVSVCPWRRIGFDIDRLIPGMKPDVCADGKVTYAGTFYFNLVFLTQRTLKGRVPYQSIIRPEYIPTW